MSTDPPLQDRRVSPRRPPSYTPEGMSQLRIARVHFRDQYLFCLLSDGHMLCVPLTISRALERAPERIRYNWRVMDDGRKLAWYAGGVGVPIEQLSVVQIVSHPEARVSG